MSDDSSEQALLERLAAIGREAGEVAHDVRNLLGVILAVADTALGRPGADAMTRDDLLLLRDAAERAAALLRQLLDGNAPVRRPFALAASLAGAAPLLRQVLGEGITLVLPPVAADGLVLADPAALERVWLNLATNARQAMGASGTLTLSLARARRPSSRTGPDRVGPDPAGEPAGTRRFLCVAVQDTGPGIPRALLPRLARPLVTGRSERGGTGLGLASVATILARVGGFLEIAGEPGQGACLLVFLPEHEAFLPEHDAAAGCEPAASGLVLLVEDEPTLSRLAERALAADGWRVLAAASAEAALARLAARPEHDPVALLVTDLSLPGLDGLALLAALREQRPDLPAIVTSGYAHGLGVLPSGAAFLAKPYALRALLALARDVTGRMPDAPG